MTDPIADYLTRLRNASWLITVLLRFLRLTLKGNYKNPL